MQKNISKTNIKKKETEEEDDMQLNIVQNNKPKNISESEDESENDENIKKDKSENNPEKKSLGDLDQDIFDSDQTFKSIGVSLKIY